MKMQIISRGKKKNGQKTAQVVFKENGKSITRHLVQVNGSNYMSSNFNYYTIGD